MIKRKGFQTNNILKKLDEEIRNSLIACSFDVLSHVTDLSYNDKIKYLMKEYHLSFSRIEDIINLDKEMGWNMIF